MIGGHDKPAVGAEEARRALENKRERKRLFARLAAWLVFWFLVYFVTVIATCNSYQEYEITRRCALNPKGCAVKVETFVR